MKTLEYMKVSFSAGLLCAVSIFGHDNHEGLHHWEIPSKDPDRIILTFYGDPATQRAVTWRTDTSVKNAVAQIAKATSNSAFKEDSITLDASTEKIDLGRYKSNKTLVVHYHSVVYKDLKPDTLYAYRVGDGQRHWSEWIQFRTAKKDYSPTKFVYFGDAQNDILAHWSRVIRMAYQTAGDANFAIHAGDLVNNAHRDHEFQSVAKGKPRNVSIQWRPQFTLPVEKELAPELHETVYTVDYQDIRIIVINSNEQLESQTKYIEKQLKDCESRWKIVTCHHSVFSPAKGRNFQFARDHWKPIFDKYGVDLVLNGHDHTYARGHVPIRTADGKETNDLGTVYVTSVSGPKQYKLDLNQIKSYKADANRRDNAAEQTQFFQVVTVENNSLVYVAYTALGEEYDRAVITKDFDTGKKRLSQSQK